MVLPSGVRRRRRRIRPIEKKKALLVSQQGFSFRSLAVTYSGMPEGHTTIGAERFHFRVRNGIGWFPLAMAARQTVRDSRAGVATGAYASNLVRFSFKRHLSRSR